MLRPQNPDAQFTGGTKTTAQAGKLDIPTQPPGQGSEGFLSVFNGSGCFCFCFDCLGISKPGGTARRKARRGRCPERPSRPRPRGPKTAYAAPGAARTEANSPPRRDRPRPAGPAPPARPPAALGSGGPRARPRPAPADSRPAARPPARPREQRARRPGSAPRAGAAQPRAGGRARGAREAGAARTLLRLGRASKAAPEPAGAPPPLTCVPTTTICGSWMMSAPTVLKTSCSLLITGISASMAPRTRDPRRPAAR